MEEQKKPNNPNDRNPFAEHELSEEDRRLLIDNYFRINHVEFPSLLSGHAILAYVGALLGLIMIFYLKNAVPTIIVSLSCFVFAFLQVYYAVSRNQTYLCEASQRGANDFVAYQGLERERQTQIHHHTRIEHERRAS